jgi:L-aspartate oxidase
MSYHYDYLILGSGIAGLSLALELAQAGTVAVLTKKTRAESNTNYAQGGIASVTSAEDSFELHVRDTLVAGAGLCNEGVVREIVQRGPERIAWLVSLGLKFSEREEQPGVRGYDLGKEGGHSKRRILHAKDVTGREIERALLDAITTNKNITILENHLAIDIILSNKAHLPGPRRALGVYALNRNTGAVATFLAPVTVLATGGCGKVYLYTTNPDIATGDGVAMAHRAGVPIANMEFIQFHPTCLYHPEAKSFLISEAVRGEGAHLINQAGERFMKNYDERGELAPRDVVARAIDAEIKRRGDRCVYLDLRHKGEDFIQSRFPNIYRTCLKYGIDASDEPIPVVPAAHYQCGGVRCGIDGQTSLHGLYALGEVACTGLHGANRLASNSLLEAVVMAHEAAKNILSKNFPREKITVPDWRDSSTIEADELVVVSHNWDEIRRLMWDYVGIVRTTKRLLRALSRLSNLAREIDEFYWGHRVTADILELRNLVLVAQLIVRCALIRKESRGLHYTLDYPQPDEAWKHDTIV